MDNKVLTSRKVSLPAGDLGSFPQRTPPNPSQTNGNNPPATPPSQAQFPAPFQPILEKP
jgi:hypothetical protein